MLIVCTSVPVTTGKANYLLRVYSLGIFQATQATQIDHPSVGMCNEYWRWGRNGEL